MSSNSRHIKAVDIFAGPGGLGEGFATYHPNGLISPFEVCLSIEKDSDAHETLLLRSFFRQFTRDQVPEEYYDQLRGKIKLELLYNSFPKQAEAASRIAWHATLGKVPPVEVDKRITEALEGSDSWILIGGPPCQAYSSIGRSRRGGINPDDDRVYLYREYLRLLAHNAPPVFVLENVKGLLSSKLAGNHIFETILNDLRNPSAAIRHLNWHGNEQHFNVKYRIYSFSKLPGYSEISEHPVYKAEDYIIKCEQYGIPQTRHRVILLGIREDLNVKNPGQLNKQPEEIPISNVLNSLPKLRSGITEGSDSGEKWQCSIKSILNGELFRQIRDKGGEKVASRIVNVVDGISVPDNGRGAEFICFGDDLQFMREWYIDPRLHGVCNHLSKAHMNEDLYRYLYAACFTEVYKHSPDIKDFPEALLPAHKNIRDPEKSRHFIDRFRVQSADKPSKTITSHLAKDGHYYIHPDPYQVRSLTVREAARLQTFPDNYYFCGNRSAQYTQVGNAVPPLLARQIAEIVFNIFKLTGLAV